MQSEIDFKLILKVLKNFWWKILIITVATMVVAGVFTTFCIDKKYSSKVSFYVKNISSTSEYTTSALITAAQQLANDYIEIIESDFVLRPLSEEYEKQYGEKLSPGAIKAMLSSTKNAEASVFSISVKSTDKELAYRVAKLIEEISPDKIAEMTKPKTMVQDNVKNLTNKIANQFGIKDTNSPQYTAIADAIAEYNEKPVCVEVLTEPKLAVNHDSPSLIKNVAISGLAAFVITYVIFLLKILMDTVIRTEDDVKKLLNKPIIGVIPTWDGSSPK